MYVLTWSSGCQSPRPLYYAESETGWFAAEEIGAAKVFNTAKECIDTWKSKLAFPENKIYIQAVRSGRVRAESINQGGLNL